MRTTKKIIVSLLACLMLITISLPVFADVIVEHADLFYEMHRDECVYNNYRRYIVNTDKGHAYLYVNPESDKTIKGYSNGEQVVIYWLYTDGDGVAWGNSNSAGWFRMSDLEVVYDTFSFIEEHKDELQDYVDGTYTVTASAEKQVIMWNYPYSKSDSFFSSDDVAKYVKQTYTDGDGEVWGYIQYYMGRRSVWVCLTDPYGEESIGMLDEGKDTTQSWLKAEPTPSDKIPMSAGNARILIIVGVLVGGVVLLTGAVIVLLFVVLKRAVKRKG